MLSDRIKLETQPDVIHQPLIDWHCHILPGLDDGAKSLDESLAIARELAAVGIKTVYCTPHCMRGVFDTTPAQVRDGMANLQGELDRAAIDLHLEPGMEYSLDEFFPEELDRLLPLGETGMVLLEAPNLADPRQLKELLFQVNRRRFIPLIAHPERSPIFQFLPERGFLQRLKNRLSRHDADLGGQASLLHELKSMGCRLQGNLGSFSGYYGSGVKNQALVLKSAGLYDCYGTDVHHPGQIRELQLAAEQR